MYMQLYYAYCVILITMINKRIHKYDQRKENLEKEELSNLPEITCENVIQLTVPTKYLTW